MLRVALRYHRRPRRWIGSGVLVAVALLASADARAAQPPAPDFIIYNADVWTGDAAKPRVNALAVTGDRITAVGSDAEIEALANDHTRKFDASGRTVIPGLNDAHAHLTLDPHDEVSADTESYNPSWPDLRAAVQKARSGAGPGALVVGTFGTKIFYDPMIAREALDEACPDLPLILTSFDGHAAILNGAALRRFGIEDSIRDPAAGKFERDAAGRLTGVAREYAVDEIWKRMADTVSDQDAKASLRQQLERAARYGITTIQDMPIAVSTTRMANLLAGIPTPIRVRITRMNVTTGSGPDFAANRDVPAHPAPLVAVNGTKWVLDGVVYEGGLTPRSKGAAAPSGGPYDFAGLPPLFSDAAVEAMLRDALRRGYQLQFHMTGTPAATQLFAAMERTGGAPVWAGRRVRVEHGDGLTPDMVAHARRLGVIVSQQGTHLDVVGIDDGLGPHFIGRLRSARAEPLRYLLDAGVPLALGSDGPLNPWLSILGATTDPNRPEEAITREQALAAYTRGSAYAEFAENEKGVLAPGKLADLAVLTQNPLAAAPADLPKIRSILTLVGGRVAYEAPAKR